MRTLAFVLCLVVYSLYSYGQDTLLLRVGTLNLDVPSTWKFSGSNQRAEGRGPDGEGVILSYRVLKPGAPEEVVDRHWQTIRSFASEGMPELASKNGEVLRPVTEQPLPEGRVQFSAVSQGTKMFRSYYFLQYLLGSPRLMVYITVEGYGRAAEASSRFEKILVTQRWDE